MSTYTLLVFLFGTISGKNKNRYNMRPLRTLSNSVTQHPINGETPLVCWYMYPT